MSELHDRLATQMAQDLPAVTDGLGETVPAKTIAGAVSRIERDLAAICEPGDVVAIACSHRWTSLAAVYATLRAGLVYLPVDDRHFHREISSLAAHVPVMATISDGRVRPCFRPSGTASQRLSPHVPLAYIVRSSGSTGHPKLIAHSRSSLSHFIAWMAGELTLTSNDVVLNQARWTSDIALLDLLAPLGSGSRIVMAPHALQAFPAALLKLASQEQVTVWQSVPSTWRPIIAEGSTSPSSLRLLILTAESLEHHEWVRLRSLLPGSSRLLNVYGSSECNDCAAWEVTADELKSGHVSIGTAIGAMELAVVPVEDECFQANGGITGELVVWGPTIFEQYLGQPELTAQRRRHRPDGAPGFAYWSGDRAHLGPDGRLQLLGRLDRRRKLQGLWVDPADIEAVVARHPGVDTAAVDLIEGPSGPALAAAVVSKNGHALEAGEIRRWCRARLQPHEVPSLVHVRDGLPRSASGKVDRLTVRDELQASRGRKEQRTAHVDRTQQPGRRDPRFPQ